MTEDDEDVGVLVRGFDKIRVAICIAASRGGNACFHTFELELHRRTDRLTYGGLGWSRGWLVSVLDRGWFLATV